MKERKWYCIKSGSMIQTSSDGNNALGWSYTSFEPSLEVVKQKISDIIFKDIADDSNKAFEDKLDEYTIDAKVDIRVTEVDPKVIIRYTGNKPITEYVTVCSNGVLIALYESVESKKYKEFIKTKEYADLKKEEAILVLKYEVTHGYTVQK